MLNTVVALLSTSYIAWYLETHEIAAVYPFDTTYATPVEAGAPRLIESAFETEDGARLVVWRRDAPENGATVVYLSGNAGTLKDRADRFAQFVDAGLGVVAPAYRGSSGSTGMPEERKLVADAAAMVAEISGPVILYGESLGAAVAIQLAAEGLGSAVVLEAPFTSLVDLVAAQYPMEDLTNTLTQRWDSLNTVGDLTQPLLVIHGEDDRIVPFAMGQSIFEAAGSEDKTFLPVARLGHAGLWTGPVQADLFDFMLRDFSN